MLAEPIFKFKDSEPVYIVGGGASLTDFNFKNLENKQVIAINRTYKVLPDAQVLFSGDYSFFDDEHQTFWRFSGEIFTTADELKIKRSTGLPFPADVLKRINYVSKESLGIKGNFESGVMAIAFALVMGAKTIILLGFDGGLTKGRKNWYSGQNDQDVFAADLSGYEEFRECKIKILNANPESAIKAFEFIPLQDALSYDNVSEIKPSKKAKAKTDMGE